MNDMIKEVENYIPDNHTIIYNLGLAVYDLFYAAKIYDRIKGQMI